MTVETKLRSAMAEAVAPTLPDTDQLVAVARRQGMGIRRRRQALSVVGAAAALCMAVLAPTFVVGDQAADTTAASVAVGTEPKSFGDGPMFRLTGRSTAAALLYAVGLHARGTASDIRGAGDSRRYPEAYVIFRFTPAGSDSAGEVAVNLDSGFTQGTTKPGDDARARIGRCESFMRRCTSTRLADGSRLTSYEDPSSYDGGRGVRRVAALYRPDVDLRVLVSASNGYDVTERGEEITRTDPVLTTEQLVAIVTQPWWGAKLPADFTAEGDRLEGYSERSSTATASPAS